MQGRGEGKDRAMKVVQMASREGSARGSAGHRKGRVSQSEGLPLQRRREGGPWPWMAREPSRVGHGAGQARK